MRPALNFARAEWYMVPAYRNSEVFEYGVCVDVFESLRIFGYDLLITFARSQQGSLPTFDPWDREASSGNPLGHFGFCQS